MDSIELGASGLRISRVVFGAMAPRGSIGLDVQRQNLRAALAAGITTIDTAPLYDFGQSERLVGELARSCRDELQILTKVGLRWDDSHGRVLFSGRGSDGRTRTVRRDSRPAAVRRDVEESLARLGVDALDLVQVHHRDPDTPIPETMGELLRLREEGKLRAVGVSNYSADEVRQAHAALGDVPLACHQLQYNLLARDPERELLPIARELGSGVLAYSPLARGYLGGHRRLAAQSAELRAAVEHLRGVAHRRGASPAQLALAWLLAQPGLSGVIVGASSRAQVADSARGWKLQLQPAELEALDRVFAGVELQPDATPGRFGRALGRVRRLASRVRRLARRG